MNSRPCLLFSQSASWVDASAPPPVTPLIVTSSSDYEPSALVGFAVVAVPTSSRGPDGMASNASFAGTTLRYFRPAAFFQ